MLAMGGWPNAPPPKYATERSTIIRTEPLYAVERVFGNMNYRSSLAVHMDEDDVCQWLIVGPGVSQEHDS